MKLKHTPGPWRKCNANNGNCPCGLIWSVKGDFVLATVTSSCKEHESSNLGEGLQRGNEEYQANSRLIAAAPEMLETLIVCYTQIDKDGWQWLIDYVSETIESATGLPIEEVLK